MIQFDFCIFFRWVGSTDGLQLTYTWDILGFVPLILTFDPNFLVDDFPGGVSDF